jgi:Mannosyltransferase putative
MGLVKQDQYHSYHSYHPRIKRWRRTTAKRFLAFALVISITYIGIISVMFLVRSTRVAQDQLATSKPLERAALEALPAKRAPRRRESRHTQPTELIVDNEGESMAVKFSTEQTLLTDVYSRKHQQILDLHSSARLGATRPQPVSESHGRFEEDLKRVISLLPDEINARELLRPVKGTGKEKLREMSLRARAFKTFYEAWERLHLVANEDSIHIRNNVVQYLRTHLAQAGLAETIRSYESFRYFLQRLSALLFPWTAPYFADHMTLHAYFYNGGRGIVLFAGDRQAPYLLTSIPSFRRLGCNLPIEVMYLGDNDLGEDFRTLLESLPGVITRDLSQMVNDEGWRLAGWAGKPFAILMSSFREVIFVDADAFFFRNPEILFQDPTYAETGALFFRDRQMFPESKKKWLQLILPKPISKQVRESHFWTGKSGHMQESGVMVIDKWKHFVALLFVTRMNGPDRDGNEAQGKIGVYDMVYGELVAAYYCLVNHTDCL